MMAFLLLALLAGTPETEGNAVLLKAGTAKVDTAVPDSPKAKKPENADLAKPLEEGLKEDLARVLPQPLPGKRKIKSIKKSAVVLKGLAGAEKEVGNNGKLRAQLESLPLPSDKAREKERPKE